MSEAKVGSIVRVHCRTCSCETKHEVLFLKQTWGDPDDSRYLSEDCFAVCRGCETACYVNIFHDYDNYVPDEGGHFEPDVTMRAFPRSVENHRAVGSHWSLPKVVRTIYEETLSAIAEEANTLAGLGLRATVEAVCNDVGVTGSNLQKRISGLATKRLISAKDAELLHAIRFMGNDAAHEIKPAKKNAVTIGLRIVEHMLLTIYLLPEEADGALEAVIPDYAGLKPVLNRAVKGMKPGDVRSFDGILGKDIRRLLDLRQAFEDEFKAEVQQGAFPLLQLGSSTAGLPGKPNIQTYERLPDPPVAVNPVGLI